MPSADVAQLKLLGIVSGDVPKAMITTADGASAIVKVGDLVGGMWTVEQIDATEILLVRPNCDGSAREAVVALSRGLLARRVAHVTRSHPVLLRAQVSVR